MFLMFIAEVLNLDTHNQNYIMQFNVSFCVKQEVK